MTKAKQKKREERVFRSFAQVALLGVDPGSIEPGERPDFSCLLDGQRTGFELTEVVDRATAHLVASRLRATREVWDAYEELSGEQKARLNRRVINIAFESDATERRLKPAARDVLSSVLDEPDSFSGELPLTQALSKGIARVTVQPSEIAGPCINPSIVGIMGDPCLERVGSKLRDQPGVDFPVELVAYYDSQDSMSFEIIRQRLTEALEGALPDSTIRRVWIWCAQENSVLFVHPLPERTVEILRRSL